MTVSVQIVFRIVSIIIGAVIGFFSYKMMKATQGASKGWLYQGITGISLFLWALFSSIFTIVDIKMGRAISGILFYPMIAFWAPIGYTQLADDFGINKFKWMKTKYLMFILPGLLIILFIYNIVFLEYTSLLIEILTVVEAFIFPCAILTALAAFFVYKGTTRKIWLVIMFYGLFVGIGMFSTIYQSGCCYEYGALNGQPVCNEFSLDYGEAIPLTCSAGLVEISYKTYNFLTLGIICLLWGNWYLYRKLSGY